MKKILIAGGYANSLLNFRGDLIDCLVGAGLEVHVTAPGADVAIRERLASKGAVYHEVPLNRAGLNPISDVIYLVRMLLLLKRISPEYYLGYTIKPVIFGSLAARLAQIGSTYVLITGLGFIFASNGFRVRLIRSVVKRLYRLALSGCTKVIFQNPDDVKEFLMYGVLRSPSKTAVVNGSGVNIERFSVVPLPKKVGFIFVGRLIKEKGICEFLAACRWLSAKGLEVNCFVAGGRDSNPSSLSEKNMEELQSPDSVVTYLGDVDDIRDALAKASVLVLPSYREGTPRSVLEAMAMGRAVVTTDVPGCRETIREGQGGVLVPPRDPVALGRAMERLARNRKEIERLAKEARRVAEERYDVRKVNREMLSIMGIS